MEGLKRTATRQTNKKGWHNSQTTQQNLLTLICMFQRNTNMPGWSFLDWNYVCTILPRNVFSFETFKSVCSVHIENAKLLSATFLPCKGYTYFVTPPNGKNILDYIFQNHKSRFEQGLLGQWSMFGVTILPWNINIPLYMFFTKKCKIQLRYFHCCVNTFKCLREQFN